MSDTAAATNTTSASPLTALPRPRHVPRRRITAKVKAAVDAMVWQGLKRDQAAEVAGLKDNSLYVALARPDVRSYYLAQCEVLRTSGRARRIHRLEEIVEQNDNKQAVVNAILALDRIEESASSASTRQQVPGFVIQVINQTAAGSAMLPDMRQIEVKAGHEP